MKQIKKILSCCLLLALCACDGMETIHEQELTVSFKETQHTIYEQQGTLPLVLVLSEPAAAPLNVTLYVKSEQNVKEEKDYLIEPRIVHFAVGEQEAAFDFVCIDDKQVNEERFVELSVLPKGLIRPSEEKGICRIVILDDESDASVSFSHAGMSVQGEAEAFFIPISVEGTPPGDIYVTIVVKSGNAIEGTHFTIKSKELTYRPGSSVSEFGVEMKIPARASDEIFESVLEITYTYNARVVIEKSTCVVTLRND